MTTRHRWLIGALRLIGLLDMIALIAVFAPRSWIESSHQLVGMGSFPLEPIAGYLARCTSIWYSTYGLLLWFVSFDVQKYARLISFLAGVMFVQGLIVMGIDLAEGMPAWWTALEGPCCSGLGAILLLLQRATEQPNFSAVARID